ncbi:hypothetical protein CRYUN_Cryun13aG0074700 [Craigia yunnanensis]
MIISPTIAQGFVTKKEFQKLLEEKNKILSFSNFYLKLPYPGSVVAKPYHKGYASPKFKQFNGKIEEAREHVMKFAKTFGICHPKMKKL